MKKQMLSVLGLGVVLGILVIVFLGFQDNKAKQEPKEETQKEETQKEETKKEETSKEEEKGPSFSSFEAESLDGESLDQELFARADLTMVNVWATFCGPCLREMPDLGELNEEYAKDGVQIVGIVLDALGSDGEISQEMVEKAKDAVESTGANYVHLLPSKDLLMAGIASIYSVPTTFFVDREGNIVGETYVGSRSKEDWKTIIEKVKSSM